MIDDAMVRGDRECSVIFGSVFRFFLGHSWLPVLHSQDESEFGGGNGGTCSIVYSMMVVFQGSTYSFTFFY